MKPVRKLSASSGRRIWRSACTQAVSPDATRRRSRAEEETDQKIGCGQTPSGQRPAESKQPRKRRKKSAPGIAIFQAGLPDAARTEAKRPKIAQAAAGQLPRIRPTQNSKRPAKICASARPPKKRIASELEQLKKSGEASPETIRDYEIYHERVQAMVAENRKIVEQMEAATPSTFSRGTSDPMRPPAVNWKSMLDPNIPGGTNRG